jgi:predicted enzyme related to lactoylglutathione lyase
MALILQETICLVEDIDRAAGLYSTAFGMEIRHRGEWGLAVLAQEDRLIVLRTVESFSREFPEFAANRAPRVTFQSTDIEGDAHNLRGLGFTVSHIVGEAGGFRAMMFTDTDGNPFFVWSAPETEPAGLD